MNSFTAMAIINVSIVGAICFLCWTLGNAWPCFLVVAMVSAEKKSDAKDED